MGRIQRSSVAATCAARAMPRVAVRIDAVGEPVHVVVRIRVATLVAAAPIVGKSAVVVVVSITNAVRVIRSVLARLPAVIVTVGDDWILIPRNLESACCCNIRIFECLRCGIGLGSKGYFLCEARIALLGLALRAPLVVGIDLTLALQESDTLTSSR